MASCVWKNLWIGSIKDANDIEFLKTKKITTIISLCSFPLENILDTISYYTYPIEDDPTPTKEKETSFFEILQEAVPIIEDKLRNGHKILVHCGAGRQRSTAVVAAYISKQTGDMEDTFAHIMTKRLTAFRVPFESRVHINWKNAIEKYLNHQMIN